MSHKNTGYISERPALGKTFTWKIENFFSLPVTIDYYVDSPVVEFSDGSWCFRIYPNGQHDEESEGFLDICAVLILPLKPRWFFRYDHKITYTFFILDNNNVQFAESTDSFHIKHEDMDDSDSDSEDSNEREVLAVSKFAERMNMYASRDKISPDGTITLICRIFCEKKSWEVTALDKPDKGIRSLRTLHEDYKNLLLNGQGCDLTLKVKDREFRAHTFILKARSQVFASMFNYDTFEKNTGVINVTDCDPEAMEQFLLFLYSGQADILDQSNVLDLYYIADKYNLPDLKKECCECMNKNLSPINICEIIQLASKHNEEYLLKYATEYFIENKNDIFCTKEWMTFMQENTDAANELLIKACKKWKSSYF